MKLQQDGRVSRLIGNQDVLLLLSVIWILQLTRKDSQRLPDAGLMQELLTQRSAMPSLVWAVHNAILISECIFQLLESFWSNNTFPNAPWCHFYPFWRIDWWCEKLTRQVSSSCTEAAHPWKYTWRDKRARLLPRREICDSHSQHTYRRTNNTICCYVFAHVLTH